MSNDTTAFQVNDSVRVQDYDTAFAPAWALVNGKEGTVVGMEAGYVLVNLPDSEPPMYGYWFFLADELVKI